jgi:hypothetical protein
MNLATEWRMRGIGEFGYYQLLPHPHCVDRLIALVRVHKWDDTTHAAGECTAYVGKDISPIPFACMAEARQFVEATHDLQMV